VQRWGGRLTLAYIHHGLRSEADAEALAVSRAASSLEASFLTAHVDVPGKLREGGGNLQSIARQLRYAALESLRVEAGADWILTAHHADDQAETLLMRFVRGTGADGLTGIHPLRGRVARPLLFANRSDLERYAREQGISWLEDVSNESDEYARNALRHHVLPVLTEYANPSFGAAMRDTAALFSSMAEFHEQEAGRLLDECGQRTERGVSLAVQPFSRYLDYQQLLVIRRAVRLLRKEHATYDETRGVQKLLGRRPGSTALLKGGCVATRERNSIVISAAYPVSLQPTPVALGARVLLPCGIFRSGQCSIPQSLLSSDPKMEVADLAKTGSHWILRPWRSGDRFRPVNGGIEKKVSDLLSEMHIPRPLRLNIPILEANGAIIWICGLRLDDRYKVTPETTSAVRFEYTQEQE
jgi:tRNA(Ile)-lysidine synthase